MCCVVQDTAKSERYLRRAVELAPHGVLNRIFLAVTLHALGKPHQRQEARGLLEVRLLHQMSVGSVCVLINVCVCLCVCRQAVLRMSADAYHADERPDMARLQHKARKALGKMT